MVVVFIRYSFLAPHIIRRTHAKGSFEEGVFTKANQIGVKKNIGEQQVGLA
jgi:hypothetical protein